MRCRCPNCEKMFHQSRNEDGLNFCPHCRGLFYVVPRTVPPWVLGVLLVLVANWQLMA